MREHPTQPQTLAADPVQSLWQQALRPLQDAVDYACSDPVARSEAFEAVRQVVDADECDSAERRHRLARLEALFSGQRNGPAKAA